jgi:glycosyltransferase involved in cell wall biosynthesis
VNVVRERVSSPFFSICIPQHNRTSFLIEACRSLQHQTFSKFEICISDDCSTDGRTRELIEFLDNSGLSFVFTTQSRNVKYDANLRGALDRARGRFAFLLGNDDCLASPRVLEEIYLRLQEHADACVAITNYADFRTGRVFARVGRTEILGAGPRLAATAFRNFSFLSGVLLRTDKAHEFATSRWDGSEMYQMFLGSRIIAAGGMLLHLDTVAVRKDIDIEGEVVDTYAARPRLDPCPIVERLLPVVQVGRLVADAIEPYDSPTRNGDSIGRIFSQLYLFTYPFWIVEYRRVQSWRYALGVCLGLRPGNSLSGLALPRLQRARLELLFWSTSLIALSVPVRLFAALHRTLYRVAKSSRWSMASQ